VSAHGEFLKIYCEGRPHEAPRAPETPNVMMGFGFITKYALYLPTYLFDAGVRSGRINATPQPAGVIGALVLILSGELAIARRQGQSFAIVQQQRGGDPMSSGTLEMVVESGRGACR
jgi:hypothetical protein